MCLIVHFFSGAGPEPFLTSLKELLIYHFTMSAVTTFQQKYDLPSTVFRQDHVSFPIIETAEQKH